MNKFKSSIISLLIGCFFCAEAQKPLINHLYAADPSAHVWPGDTNTLWLYTSLDVPNTNHHATMFGYHVFSTKDLVHWTDYGRVLSVDNVDWAISHAWAIDAAFHNGKYYLVFCMRDRSDAEFKIGLAVSNLPQGPFKSIGKIEGIEKGMDPSIFIDDKQPYLIWANARHGYIAPLTDDLMAINKDKITDITAGLPQFQEGPWIHKRKGTYYFSYPGLINDQWPEVMYYATSKTLTGKYTSGGIFIPTFQGSAGTNHGSIIEFKGQSMMFHHNATLSGGNSYVRNLLADVVTYDKNGAIKTIIPSDLGISSGKPTITNIHLEAENGVSAGGRLEEVRIENTLTGFSGKGYVTGFHHREAYTEVLVEVAKELSFDLKLVYAAKHDTKIAIQLNEVVVNGGYTDWKDIIVPKSESFSKTDVAKITLKAGENKIRFFAIDGDVKLDALLLETRTP